MDFDINIKKISYGQAAAATAAAEEDEKKSISIIQNYYRILDTQEPSWASQTHGLPQQSRFSFRST